MWAKLPAKTSPPALFWATIIVNLYRIFTVVRWYCTTINSVNSRPCPPVPQLPKKEATMPLGAFYPPIVVDTSFLSQKSKFGRLQAEIRGILDYIRTVHLGGLQTVMARTYIPSLHFFINKLHEYATRYQEQLEASLGTTEKVECLRSLIATLAACLPILIPPPPES